MATRTTHVIQHFAFEHAGVIGNALRARGHALGWGVRVNPGSAVSNANAGVTRVAGFGADARIFPWRCRGRA